MEKVMIPYEEEATTDVQIIFPDGDISDGYYQTEVGHLKLLIILNWDIDELSVIDATRKKKDRRPTNKGKEYQLSLLDGRRKKLTGRLQRKSTIINKILFCKGNIVAVREELCQLDNSFKIIEDTHMVRQIRWEETCH